ncbi:type II secretion system minor pseudopilin GspH [Pseudomonas sp. 5P_3.1_Bac2]|uniref:type II secretion system minor pseudopilin GspH n=1 Tax=Pseudomonas sp. 5P_3.1_Bac2 TaxID=2971617 RepID=UPI0021C922D3|nr:type II secretion system minor pseudopilin GspH [Pseudomonas sp. 5P_3.1_Bac2]MCU1717745.1 type II secretion system minor pseudopilin GspH [Pseudomonas sp. 5P_3.1_Bac2]
MRTQRQRGFTLLEVLVTLLLIAVSCAVVGLVAPDSAAREARHEAQRLQALLQLLREQAVLNFHDYGLRIDSDGYAVWQLDDAGQWQRSAEFTAHQLPRRLSLRVQIEEADRSLPTSGSLPQIHLLSSDQSSAYSLIIQAEGKPLLRLFSDGIADAELAADE